ncbi:NAD(P)H nitroreductase [Mycobacterium spongiae]|uniref:NAD(P)H nitroreductase n=1 Tax=Mycobacterium spongiae TaxID=886343 RepID=A0A975PYS6_9MYCO|nr:NAD(P)H nitroreductase [Mycobacterium spongiae]
MDLLQKAVLLACRAPSVHNSQPWRWVVEPGPTDITIRLFVDRHRMVPATDRSGRQTLISCGAVLDHFRIAMAAARWQANIARFPVPNEPDQLAVVDFEPADHLTRAERDRAHAILHRRTDRLPFDRPRNWQLFAPSLVSTFDDGALNIDVLSDEQRPLLAEASRVSEALRREDASYCAEIQWWTSPFTLDEGVPASALASDTERLRVDVRREFPVRGHQNRRAEVTADQSKILVLSTPEDTAADVLRCGEALSTVLLDCTTAGMATCTLTHLIESDDGRDILRGLIGHRGEPQVLLRVGTSPAMEHLPPPTPRRPLADVVEIR